MRRQQEENLRLSGPRHELFRGQVHLRLQLEEYPELVPVLQVQQGPQVQVGGQDRRGRLGLDMRGAD